MLLIKNWKPKTSFLKMHITVHIVSGEEDISQFQAQTPFHKKCILSNLCRATSRGYINFGCSREFVVPRRLFSKVIVSRGKDIFAVRKKCRSRRLDIITFVVSIQYQTIGQIQQLHLLQVNLAKEVYFTQFQMLQTQQVRFLAHLSTKCSG